MTIQTSYNIIHIENTHYMKRRDLIKKLLDAGFVLLRNGSNHDVYGKGSVTEPIPRHTEVPEGLARKILKRNNII